MDLPWDRRGARGDEHIALLRAIWTAPGKHVQFHGEFWRPPPMDPEPRPVQQPIPILLGGHSEPAMDRAVRLGDGCDRRGGVAQTTHRAAAAPSRRLRSPSTATSDPADLLPIKRHDHRRAATVEALGVHAIQVDVETLDDLMRLADEVLPHFR